MTISQGWVADGGRATRELAAIQNEFSESRRLLMARFEQLFKDAVDRGGKQLEVWTPPKVEQQALTDAHKAGREEVLARFREALAALYS